MIVRTVHAATWATVWARLSLLVAAALAWLPNMFPRDMADWFAQQFPFLPSWAHYAAAAAVFLARMAYSARKILREEVP